ncbi:MAG: AraC family transcriptional regulator [Janthinobacterium lividum]
MSIIHNNIDLREKHIIGSQTRELIVSSALCPSLGHHEISLVGLTEAGPDFEFVRPNHYWSQLLACTGGAGWVWLDSRWVRCKAGQVYVTPAYVFHAYRADPMPHSAVPWTLCWIQSSGDWLSPGDRPLLLTADPSPLAEAISGLHREVMHSTELALLPSWAFLIYSYAVRLARPGVGDLRLRGLWDSVNTDLAAPWTVDKLARQIGLSPEHLRRLSKTHHAVSPMRHVTALRMRRAAALLASESYTIEAVAQRVGYDSPYAFSTAFKRLMGVPPSEYRQGNPRVTVNR